MFLGVSIRCKDGDPFAQHILDRLLGAECLKWSQSGECAWHILSLAESGSWGEGPEGDCGKETVDRLWHTVMNIWLK